MLIPTTLRCEYLENPIGLDVIKPRYSWIIQAAGEDAASLYQTAFHVIVASTKEGLDRWEGDLWDSGRVESSQSAQIEYEGVPLRSCAWCYWKIRIWDENGVGSSWDDCEAAYWHVGLLTKPDWGNAQWIGAPKREPRRIAILNAASNKEEEIIASDPSPLLRAVFTVPASVNRAILYVTSLGE